MNLQLAMMVDGINANVYSTGDPRHTFHTPILANYYFKALFEVQAMGPDLTPEVQPLMDFLSGKENLLMYEQTISLIKKNQPH